jgi:hypothetical protein
MSAVLRIDRYVGPEPGTAVDITTTNTVAHARDEHLLLTADAVPIHIPFSGFNYSYWVTTRLRITTSPVGFIDNIRWYTNGNNTFGQGVQCFGNSAGAGPNGGYVRATGVDGVTGTVLNRQNHIGLNFEPLNVFEAVETNPIIIPGSGSAIGPIGSFFVYQIRVDNTAAPGPSRQEVFIWAFDES